MSDVGTMDNGTPYIVMEYLEGHDLSHALAAQTRLAPSVVVDYVLQACEAIAEAHAAGFVHRDLKPGNLFLAQRPDGSVTVKVLDFGISKAVIADNEPSSVKPGALTRTTDIFGSPLYMSPEQLKSSRDVDPRADIWAIGVILYELVTGQSPFDRPTVAETFGAILYEKPASIVQQVPGFPPELEAAILRCIEKDAGARFQNVADLAKALFPFAENASRQSLERTSRVLMRAGVAVDAAPPASLSAQSLRAVASGGAVGASTRTSWGAADGAPKPRSSARAVVIGAGVGGLVVAVGIFFGVTRLGGARPAATTPSPDRAAATVAAPAPTVVVAPTATAVVTAVPTATAEAAPAATTKPTATAQAAPTVTPAPPAPPPRKGKAPPPAAPPVAAAPQPPTPPPPPPKHEDPNDFGDRK